MAPQGEPKQIDRDYVRLLMVMRRFVRDEFDVKIGISEADAAQSLLEYANRSRNQVLREMGNELSELLTPPKDESPAEVTPPGEKMHYYRGVPQQSAASKAEPVAAEKEPEQSNAGKRIYRGRVVSG